MKYAEQGFGDHELDSDFDAVDEDLLPGSARVPAKQLFANISTQDENPTEITAPTGTGKIDLTKEPAVTNNGGLASVSPGSLGTLINGVSEGKKMSMNARIAYIMENGQPFCNHCESYYVPKSLGKVACTDCGCGRPNDDHGGLDQDFSHTEGATVADEVGGREIIKEESFKGNLSTTDDYLALFQYKVATDSDNYYRGYNDAMNGEELDEDFALLSDDYFNGYEQRKFFNKTPQESVAQSLYNIKPNSNNIPRGMTPGEADAGPMQLTDGVGRAAVAGKLPFPTDVIQDFFEI